MTYCKWEVGIDGYQPIGMYYGESETDAISECKSELSMSDINIRKEFHIPKGEYLNFIAVKFNNTVDNLTHVNPNK